MHIRNYERPDGWNSGQPEVLVAPNVISHLEMPVVNYESLHQFLVDDLGIPYDERTTVKLYGNRVNSPFLGFHQTFTKTIHINAIASEYSFHDTGGTMRILAHEARHRADSTNRKALTLGETAVRLGSYRLGYEIIEAIPYLSAFAVLGGIKARSIYYKYEPAEKRARAEEEKQSTQDHELDIIFPKSLRTPLLLVNNELPLDLSAKLRNNIT